MFGFNFRPFMPGFWISPEKLTPGFNVKEVGVAPLPLGLADTQEPSDAPTAEREFVIQAPPLTDLPGFQLFPEVDIPGFNVGEDGVLHAGVVPAPDRGRVQAAAPSTLRADSQHNVPGFNVRSGDDVVGFHPDENSAGRQGPIWSAPPSNLPPGIEEGPAKTDPRPPEWSYDRAASPSPPLTTLDPAAGLRIATYPLPSATSVAAPVVAQWPFSGAPYQSPETATRTAVAPTEQHDSQSGRSTMSSPWLQPQKDGWPHASGARPLSLMPSVGRPAASSSIFAKAEDAGTPRAQQPTPLQQYLAKQWLPVDAGPAMAELRDVSGTKPTGADREPPQDSPKPGGANRASDEARNGPPNSAAQSPPSKQTANETFQSSRDDEPSLAQRLAQSSVDALAPGAHYQNLARRQLEAKNYLGAAVYQTAALADAVLGVATLGLSTRAAAAGRVAAAEGAGLFRRSFDSVGKLKRYLEKAPEKMQWHHIVEQSQVEQFGQHRIQSIENIVAIPREAHTSLNAHYSSKRPFSRPDTVRKWLRGQSFEEQYEYGMKRLKEILGY